MFQAHAVYGVPPQVPGRIVSHSEIHQPGSHLQHKSDDPLLPCKGHVPLGHAGIAYFDRLSPPALHRWDLTSFPRWCPPGSHASKEGIASRAAN
jgi:hypothetical protein